MLSEITVKLVIVVKAGIVKHSMDFSAVVQSLLIPLNLGKETSEIGIIPNLLNSLLSFLEQKFSKILLVEDLMQEDTSTNSFRLNMVFLFAMMSISSGENRTTTLN